MKTSGRSWHSIGGIYTPDDYNTWRTNFGLSFSLSDRGSGATGSADDVPEPATIVLFLFGTAGICLPRGRAV
jgi:hypothetical protein